MLYLEEGEDWLKLNDRDYNYIHNNMGSEDIKAWKAEEMILGRQRNQHRAA